MAREPNKAQVKGNEDDSGQAKQACQRSSAPPRKTRPMTLGEYKAQQHAPLLFCFRCGAAMADTETCSRCGHRQCAGCGDV
jgi:hypothetical protein